MIILTIISFFTSLFNIGSWIGEIFNTMLLWIDGAAYSLLSYSFKLFQLMCTLNFNSLQGLVSGLLTRIEALVMVFVVYKLGIALINFMLNPDEASKKGKDILINIFITAALLLSYNTIFTLFNEISMLLIGVPENYNFVVLGQIADITGTKDIGLVNRLVFGTNEEMPDVGEYIAFSTASIFITDATDPQNTVPLKKELATEDGHLDFFKLPNIAPQIGKKFDYFPFVGFLGAAFMIYSFVKTTIQIGVRAFKLLILQILAPVAIITIIGEGIKGKVFKNFTSKYISVFIEVFTRMFTTLLISTFVVKFIRNFNDYFPQINTDEWWTYALMVLLFLVAAFKFAGDIPKFIDEILGTHLSTGSDKNFIGGLLGAGMGAVAGFAGGVAGGNLASGFASMAGGMLNGAKEGVKGNKISELFKGQGQVFKGQKTATQNRIAHRAEIRSRGGYPNVWSGAFQNHILGTGHKQDKLVAEYDAMTQALDAFDQAQIREIEDYKTEKNGTNDAIYASGYENIKLGSDDNAYASKMLAFDNDYIKADAAIQQAIAHGGKDSDGNTIDIAALETAKAQAQQAAEKRAKDYWKAKKNAANGTEVQQAHAKMEATGIFKEDKKGNTIAQKDDTGAFDIKKTKKEISSRKNVLTTSKSYSQTHGQNPNKNK